MVAALGQGAGKLKVREFCLCPLPGTGASLSQQMRMLERVHFELGKYLAVKMGVSELLADQASQREVGEVGVTCDCGLYEFLTAVHMWPLFICYCPPTGLQIYE